MAEDVTIQQAQFDDQGKVGEFLFSCLGAAMQAENDMAVAAGMPPVDVADELMAADDFYFSSVELMDCCIIARTSGKIVGAACVNPFTSTLHFITVAPDWRRQGIGRKMLAGAKLILKKRGCDHIKIEYPQHSDFAGAADFFAACAMPASGSPKVSCGCQIAPRREEPEEYEEEEE